MSKLVVESLYENSRKIVVTTHRGYSGRLPENTLLAFGEAVRLGVDLIEFDLRGCGTESRKQPVTSEKIVICG